MANNSEIEAKFWKSAKSDKTMMLSLANVEKGHSQPMTAQFDEDAENGPIWFFTSKETDFVKEMGGAHDAAAHFVSKSHDLFASLDGRLVADNDRAMIDKLWSPFVAAWFEGGKDDPNLQLVRFEPTGGQIWLNEHSLFAGIKLLLGSDPKKDAKGQVAELKN